MGKVREAFLLEIEPFDTTYLFYVRAVNLLLSSDLLADCEEL
jgi:hypothetical protein